MFVCFVAAAVLAALLNAGLVRIPTMLSVFFLVVVVAMAYELGWDVIAAARLTARLRASEESLRESEQRLQLAAGAGELGLWEWNVAADDVWMTPECRALFGYRADEPVGLSRFLESVHPDDRAAVKRGVSASLPKGGDDFEQDFRIVLPDGRVRWVTSRGRIERDETGAAARMRGVTHDVTARRQAEERFRTLVEAAPNAMLVVDADGVIVLANARAETMFGYARKELVGRSVDVLVPERLRNPHNAHRQAYRHEWRPRAMGAGRELFAIRKDGTELPVEVGLNPMQTSEGRFVIASVVDVSERKRSELEAARQRDEMAHLARVAMLGELSGSLAHELNQPLAAILSNAQAAQRFLARDPPQLDRVTEILADIVTSDKRAGAVITRLRSLLRKEEAQHQPVDMNEVVQEVLALMRSDLAQPSGRRAHRARAAASRRVRRPGPAAAGAAEPPHQRVRRHGRVAGAARSDRAQRMRAGRARESVRRRPRHGDSDPGPGTHLRAVRDDQAAGDGPGAGGLPLHRQGAQRPAMGRQQPRRRCYP